MTEITRLAPAKINLYLEITGRRPDGYHDIESVMQTLTLADELTFTKHEPSGSSRITLTCSDPTLACDASNLCIRAANAFFAFCGIASYHVDIHVKKRIPVAAGLGGGSSDAAATLCALSELYEAGLTEEKLCEIGVKLGADVPFCIRQGISVTRGIGEIFEPCAALPDCTVLLACTGEGVSTPWAYRRLDEMYDFSTRKTDITHFRTLLSGGDLRQIAAGMTNIFESAVLPERTAAAALRQKIEDGGALRAMMSGSGPSVFGIFSEYDPAEKTAQELLKTGIPAHICNPFYPKAKK